MAFGLFLMDIKENSIYKMESKKRLNLSKIDKILKVEHNFVLHSINIILSIVMNMQY